MQLRNKIIIIVPRERLFHLKSNRTLIFIYIFGVHRASVKQADFVSSDDTRVAELRCSQ